jgi:Fic family protein
MNFFIMGGCAPADSHFIPVRILRRICGDYLVYSPQGGDTFSMNTDALYIWQENDWTVWRYDLSALQSLMTDVRLAQNDLHESMSKIGMGWRDNTRLNTLTDDVIKSSQIEGEALDPESVRSSIARRLGIDIGVMGKDDRKVDGVVDMIMDATENCNEPVTLKRLLGWQAALFPTGYSGMTQIMVGKLRDDADGPMQVVSGPVNRRHVHFEAMPADRLDVEMARFLHWVDNDDNLPPLLKAGIGHLWLVTIHPFEDGNGRVSRALGDLLLARADGSPKRFYSLSAQIQSNRKDYYDVLERTEKGSMDVTEWLHWFLENLLQAVEQASKALDDVFMRARFWHKWGGTAMNYRQAKVINRLLDDFQGNLTAKKWAALAKCSPDTALRDITDLIERGLMHRSESGGRSASYLIDTADSP